MYVQRALSARHSNTCTGQAVNPTRGRATSSKLLAASARAVRPLAASARLERFGKDSGLCAELALSSQEKTCVPAHSLLRESKKRMQALRRGAKPNTRGRAGTSCFAARAGGFGFLAHCATQRTMHAGSVPPSALPNPSIERTNNGGSSFTAFAYAQPPLFASHLKRWASLLASLKSSKVPKCHSYPSSLRHFC
jgi:hypothetical protein